MTFDVCQTLALAIFVSAVGLTQASVDRPNHYGDDNRLARWVDASVTFIRNLTCNDSFLTTEEDCRRLISVPMVQINIYVAEPTPEGRLYAVLPDGPLNRAGAHDAVLTLDPYPRANLGHLLIVFFIDVGWSELQCEVNGGQYLGHRECLSLALKNRCHNLLMEAKWRRKYVNRRCEINFLPLVHVAGELPNQERQRLSCRDDIGGFAPCPELRPLNETDSLICNPLQSNTQRCSTTHETGSTRCRLFEQCDHAVLLSGGWDRLTSLPHYKRNLKAMYEMLRRNGFPKENIKVFYANGGTVMNAEDGEETYRMYPSAFKLAIRYHIRKLCQSPHCADSLLLYLNSPTRSDGASLLWDVDGNGQAYENEIYTGKEMLFDLQDCAARQVYIIADQNYGGELVRALEHSSRHAHVMAFTSGQEHEYSWNSELTKHWANFRHSHTCVGEVHKASQQSVRSSNPMLYDGSGGTIEKTLFGAPCDIMPPFTEDELRVNYYGCQNLPTSVWMGRSNSQDNL